MYMCISLLHSFPIRIQRAQLGQWWQQWWGWWRWRGRRFSRRWSWPLPPATPTSLLLLLGDEEDRPADSGGACSLQSGWGGWRSQLLFQVSHNWYCKATCTIVCSWKKSRKSVRRGLLRNNLCLCNLVFKYYMCNVKYGINLCDTNLCHQYSTHLVTCSMNKTHTGNCSFAVHMNLLHLYMY